MALSAAMRDWCNAMIANGREKGKFILELDRPPERSSEVASNVYAYIGERWGECVGLRCDNEPWFDDRWLEALVGASHLSGLRSLNFRSCKGVGGWGLRALAGAAHLSGLESLDLSYTRVNDWGLEALAGAAHLSELRSLNFRSCKGVADRGLEALAGAAHLSALKSLDIVETSATLPKEIKNSDEAHVIIAWYRERRERPLGEFKLLLVGQGETGKTHLRKSLFEPGATGTYHRADEERTHDIDQCSWKVPLPNDRDIVTARVWDFGGQNELHSTHRCFLGGERCFYVLVVRADRPADDEAKDSNRLAYWLRLIANYGKTDNGLRAPLLIVVSQCDRIDLERDPKKKVALAAGHAELKSALEQARKADWYGANVVGDPIDGLGWSRQSRSDARHQSAVEAIHRGIIDHLTEVPRLDAKMARSLFAVKRWIEQTFATSETEGDGAEVPYFDYRRNRAFQGLREGQRIGDDLLPSYLSILKSLGMIHWVGDVKVVQRGTHSDMQHLVFNPEWVRRPVYELIRTAESREAGLLSWDALKQQLPERPEGTERAEFLYRRLPFAERERNHILGLMLACRLAYDDKRKEGLLIPDLLRSLEPGESERGRPEWTTADVGVWKAEADFLPEKVFLRLLADHYKEIERPSKECFRNEVQLTFKVRGRPIRALLHPVYSPPGGARPYIEMHITGADVALREAARDVLEMRIRLTFDEEDLGDVQIDIPSRPVSPKDRPTDERPHLQPVALPGEEENIFRREVGGRWLVRFRGWTHSDLARLDRLGGMEYIHTLLNRAPDSVRLDELDGIPRIPDAEFFGQPVGDGTGERFPCQAEGTQRRVGNRLSVALEAIRQGLPDLADHLDARGGRGRIRTCLVSDNYHMRYLPPETITWET